MNWALENQMVVYLVLFCKQDVHVTCKFVQELIHILFENSIVQLMLQLNRILGMGKKRRNVLVVAEIEA